MLDVLESKELQATILAFRGMDASLRKTILKETRGKLLPEWKQELSARSISYLTDRVLVASSRVDVTGTTVKMKAATSKKKMLGGASPFDIGHAVEFGAASRFASENTGTARRTINMQFKRRNRRGYVAWPAAVSLVPRFASLWVQICMRATFDAIDGKR